MWIAACLCAYMHGLQLLHDGVAWRHGDSDFLDLMGATLDPRVLLLQFAESPEGRDMPRFDASSDVSCRA